MASCTTFGKKPKVKHTSKVSAWEHAKKYQSFSPIEVQIYRCHHCRYWHVGRKPYTRAQRRFANWIEKHEEQQAGMIVHYLRQILDN